MTNQTKVDIKDVDLSHLTTMSSKIRYLDSLGFTRSEIKNKLNIRYQWVRNVLITPIKKQK